MEAEPKASERSLGFWMCLALVVGNMIGSGVYLLPAALAPYGLNAILGWLVTIGGALCLAFVIARLALALPGGPYGYTRTAFGPAVAFFVMWSFWISIWVSNAALSIAGVSYLSVFAPELFARPGVPALAAIGFVVLFTLIGNRGARASGAVQIGASVLKVLPLIAAVVIAIAVLTGGAEPSPDFAATPVGPAGVAGAAALTLWAMLGFESAAVSSAKVRDPERTIPRATLAGTFITGVVYLFACSAVFLLLPREAAAHSNAPFADLVGAYWGSAPATFVALFAAISALGALNGWVLLAGEVPLTLARDRVFPAWFGATDAGGTPLRAQWLAAAATIALIAMNYSRGMAGLFAFMALLATVATLVLYLACAASALVLIARGTLRSRLLTTLASIGFVYSLWTLYGAGAEATGWGATLLATGLPVWWAMRTGRAAAQSTG